MYAQKQEGYFFMIRTKVPGGKLTPEQARVIGEVTEEDLAVAPEEYGGEEQNELWGDAYLDITTRQDIQKHWIRVEDVPEMWNRYDEVGLTTVQGCGDSARNVLGCPAAGLDDHECFNAQPVIEAVSDFFTENREYANLPRKFKITITGCAHDCAQSQINDVGPRSREKGDRRRIPLRLPTPASAVASPTARDGFGTRRLHQTRRRRRVLSRRRPDVQGDRRPQQPRCLPHALPRRTAWPREVRGGRPRPLYDRPADRWSEPDRRLSGRPRGRPRPEAGRAQLRRLQRHRRPDGRRRVRAAAARAAEKYGTEDASVRLATDQNFLVTHIPDENVDDLLAEPFAQEYSPDPGPFSRGAVGCTGNEFCNYAIIETKSAPSAGPANSTSASTCPTISGPSGCICPAVPASCAQPQIADIGFRGETVKLEDEDGDDIVEGMDFGLGGSLGADNEFLDGSRAPCPPIP